MELLPNDSKACAKSDGALIHAWGLTDTERLVTNSLGHV